MSQREFDAHGFIRDRVFPRVKELPPEQWLPQLKKAAARLPPEERRMVQEEAVRILRRRREIVDAVGEAVREVRAMTDEHGRPYGEVFKGVILRGSFTGVSRTKADSHRALEPDSMGDLDMYPVVNYGSPKRLAVYSIEGRPRGEYVESDDPLFGDLSYMGIAKPRGALTTTLKDRITSSTGIKASVLHPITVAPDDPQATIDDVRMIRSYRPFEPKAWHFIGDEETGRLLAERLELTKPWWRRMLDRVGGR